jgi:hypothetical protein
METYQLVATAVGASLIVGIVVAAVVWCLRHIKYLGPQDQLRIKRLTHVTVVNGPAVCFPNPLTTLSAKKRAAIQLADDEYCLIKDESVGKLSTLDGPCRSFLGPYDTVVEVNKAHILSEEELLHVKDRETGKIRLVKGPQRFVPKCNETVAGPGTMVPLQKDEYIQVRDAVEGTVRIEHGEQLLVLQPTESVMPEGARKGYTLAKDEFVRLRNKSTGEVRVMRGEALVFPQPFEETLERPRKAIDLKAWEYCVIQDVATGERRTMSGEALVWLSGSDRVIYGSQGSEKQSAVRVDLDHAALVRNKSTGVQHLVSEPGLFFPHQDEEVVEVQERIVLADHEAVVLVSPDGKYSYHYGDPAKPGKRAFFVPPHSNVLELRWSRGRKREKRDLRIKKLDMRPQYMSFEFSCRTGDNVEMVLEGTFFWEVVSLPDMLQFTGDAPGDVCSHARSCFIALISKVSLSDFMARFNEIAKEAHSNDDDFYSKRGLKIHSLEVTRYACADASTAEILEEIITETTNRMNRLSVQESTNEVAIAKMQGELALEKATTELLEAKQAHAVEGARAEGAADAQRIVSFFSTLREADTGADANACWQALRRGEALTSIASGTAHVLFGKDDVNLSIEQAASYKTKTPRPRSSS